MIICLKRISEKCFPFNFNTILWAHRVQSGSWALKVRRYSGTWALETLYLAESVTTRKFEPRKNSKSITPKTNAANITDTICTSTSLKYFWNSTEQDWNQYNDEQNIHEFREQQNFSRTQTNAWSKG